MPLRIIVREDDQPLTLEDMHRMASLRTLVSVPPQLEKPTDGMIVLEHLIWFFERWLVIVDEQNYALRSVTRADVMPFSVDELSRHRDAIFARLNKLLDAYNRQQAEFLKALLELQATARPH